MPKHILVIGATGALGTIFCAAALAANHMLTIYARNPSKLPGAVSSHPNVTIVAGDLGDTKRLREAIEGGGGGGSPDVFVSFAGPTPPSKGTPVLDSMRIILPLLVKNHVRRVLVLCTPAYAAPEDRGALKWAIPLFLLRILGGAAAGEMAQIGELVASSTSSSQDGSNLGWTLFRVPYLTDGPEAPVHAGFVGDGKGGMSLSRRSIVRWVLKAVDDDTWVGKAPLLLN